jgi:phage terminase large subunit
MSDLVFKAFGKQSKVLKSNKQYLGAFAGKRGGKTEVGAIWSIKEQEEKRNYIPNGIDPYLGVVVAPTNDMLARLSWKKFMAYAKTCGFIKKDIQSPFRIAQWHDSTEERESIVYGISGDRPERIEGVKANWIWIDEVFQVKEQLFLECLARVSDSQGRILCTGSLGVQFINPKQHWAYKYFKEQIDADFECFEWGTSDNPHYPKEEIEKAKNRLDKQTFSAMFEICWDVIPQNAVYADFSDENIAEIKYNPELPTFCCVDWGWAHPMACGIFQYDKEKDTVYLIDEKVESKMTLEELSSWIKSKPYKIQEYICDIAGNQEREQSGISNVMWFKRNHSIFFKYRTSRVVEGIANVRSYIKNTKGLIRFYIDKKCEKSIAGIKRYKYPEKDGKIINENPLKVDDDEVDMIRYFFMKKLDPKYKKIKPISMGSYR